MSFAMITGIAVGLALDAMAVGIGVSISLRGARPRQVFRLSFHFGLFQALMPVLGWLLGQLGAPLVSHAGHWMAFLLLSAIGGRAVWSALDNTSTSGKEASDPTRGVLLLSLSMATSVDAFVTGVSFAMLNITVWYPAAVIGVVTAVLTVVGMVFGGLLGRRVGVIAEILGGLTLIGIGLKCLFSALQ